MQFLNLWLHPFAAHLVNSENTHIGSTYSFSAKVNNTSTIWCPFPFSSFFLVFTFLLLPPPPPPSIFLLPPASSYILLASIALGGPCRLPGGFSAPGGSRVGLTFTAATHVIHSD